MARPAVAAKRNRDWGFSRGEEARVLPVANFGGRLPKENVSTRAPLDVLVATRANQLLLQ